MKNSKSIRAYEYDEDENGFGSRKNLQESKRRPIRNLKQAWQNHEQDFEDIDDFFFK